MSMFIFNPTMEFLIPFLFVLAVVFGLLELTLKAWSRPVKLMIALALSFFSVGYQPFVTALWSYLPSITWFFIAMFFVAFMVKMFGIKKRTNPLETMAIQGGILFVLLAVGWTVADQYSFIIPILGTVENLLLLVSAAFILMIFWTAFKIGIQETQAQPKQ